MSFEDFIPDMAHVDFWVEPDLATDFFPPFTK
jgi:hypothetical protein